MYDLTLHLKKVGKNKPKVSGRREIIQIRAEINKIQTSKIIKKINETKLVFRKDKQNW